MATGVPEADVFAAADRVLARGERPTVERVRIELGRGSPSRIGQLLEQWWDVLARRLAAETRLPELPKDVAQAFHTLWSSAIAQAEHVIEVRVAAEREALQQAQAALADERTHWQAGAEATRLLVESAQQARSTAEIRLVDAQQLAERQGQQLVDVLRQRDALQARVDRLTDEVATLGARLQQQEAVAAAERESQARHLRAMEDRSHGEVDRARQETKELRTQFTTLQREHSVRERQRDEALSALSAAQREAAGHRARSETLEKQLARLGELHTTLRSSLAHGSGTSAPKRPLQRKKKESDAPKGKAKRSSPKLPAGR